MFRRTLRKKQTQIRQGRTVRPRQPANVFSYYSARSGTTRQQSRRTDPAPPIKREKDQKNLRRTANRWAAYIPSLIVGLVLLLCMVYVSTLTGNPRLQMVGNPQASGLVAGVAAYETDVQAVFSESLLNRSKLLINTDELAKKLQDKFPELGEVAVVLPLIGRRPIVQIRPAEPALTLGTLQGALVIDEHGRTIAKARDVESSILDKLPTLQDESGLSLERGNYALPEETVTFVKSIAGQLDSKRLKVGSMLLPVTANELHVRLQGKPYFVKFNVRGQGRTQVGTFIATKEKLEAGKITPREYIDVRVPGKAFYK